MPLLLPNPFCNPPGAGALPSPVLLQGWSPFPAAVGSPEPSPEPSPLPPWQAPTHTPLHGHGCVQLLSPEPTALEDATCLGTSVGFSHLKPQSWQVKTRGVTRSLAMKGGHMKPTVALQPTAHSQIWIQPLVLQTTFWSHSPGCGSGTSSAQHTKLLLAQGVSGNREVTPPAQSSEFL